MAKGLIEASVLTDIANAIRAKDGSTAKMLASAMEGKIRNISTTPTIKTGTFTPTSIYLKGQTITVSNLGGTPKHVIICFGTTASSLTANPTRMMVFWQKGLADGFLSAMSFSGEDADTLSLYNSNNDSKAVITFTNKGFTITSTASSGGLGVFKNAYRYWAFM